MGIPKTNDPKRFRRPVVVESIRQAFAADKGASGLELAGQFPPAVDDRVCRRTTFGIDNTAFLLADEMGAGKTVIHAVADLYRKGDWRLRMVEKINRVEQEMVVNFEGRLVQYDFGDLDELSLPYVLSIHKS